MMTALWELLVLRQDEFIRLFFEHLNMTVAAVLVAACIGIPLGILITKSRRLASLVIGFANVLQSVPCIALLAFSIPFVGIGAPAAIVMVVVYALLPILKNTYTGVLAVDPKLAEVARGMGMSPLRYLRTVEWPLAAPSIMSGVRIAAVSAVGTMTIAAFAGAGGLGWYINLGLNAQNQTLVLLGAIPASVMAVGLDALLALVERRVSAVTKHTERVHGRLSKVRDAVLVGVMLALTVSPVASWVKTTWAVDDEPTVVVGSANFTEGVILGSMLTQLIEAKTDVHVETRFNLNGEGLCYTALDAGKIDIFTGYSGAVLMNYLHQPLTTKDPAAVLTQVRERLAKEKALVTTGAFGFANTYQMTVSPEVADKYGLKTVADLMAKADRLVMGSTVDFMQRDDGVEAMVKTYGARPFKKCVGLDGTLRYTALGEGEVDVIDAFSTDGLLAKMPVVALEDADHFFPPYDAFAMIRQSVCESHPELIGVLKTFEGLIDEKAMRELNYRVDVEGRDAAVVARDFLLARGLITAD